MAQEYTDESGQTYWWCWGCEKWHKAPVLKSGHEQTELSGEGPIPPGQSSEDGTRRK